MSNIKRITFVWNADFNVQGGLNALKEIVKGEHSCSLCEIAYHKVTQTKEWKSYKKHLSKQYDASIKEPCKNQLKKSELAIAVHDYPTVLAHTDKGVVKLLGGDDINSCSGDIKLFRKKLDEALSQRFSA